MKTTVFVTLQVEGIHNFPDADQIFPAVGYLKHPHRHMFHIKAGVLVQHNNRDREFILLKQQITDYLYQTFGVPFAQEGRYHYCDFGPRSCEQIATIIFNRFDCEYVEVSEDNESGARVEK